MADEDMQQRETYGGAPGWSQNQKIAAGVSTQPAQDATVESSPTPDAEAAPSADAQPSEDQSSEQATPPTSQPEPQKPFNMPPPERWEELRREREEARQQAAEARQLAQLALQKLQNPQAPVQPEIDPYAGMDAPTAEFYRNLDRRIEMKAAQLAEQKLQPLAQAYEAGRRKLAEIEIGQFRKDNPDIKANSEEEKAIAGYVQSGFDLLSAKKLALFDKLEAENRALKGKQATIPQKRAAAQSDSSAGIPATAGLPPRPGDWRQKAGDILDKGGTLKDVLGTVFGGSRST